MKKSFSILASAIALLSMVSCNTHSGKNTLERTFPRNMMAATVDPSGNNTVYTATAGAFTIDAYNPSNAKLAIASIKMPDNNVMNMPTASDLQLGTSATEIDYTFTNSPTTKYTNFTSDMPTSISATLSALTWTVLNSSNSSIEIDFASGNRLTAFGAEFGFFTNTSVYDSENPSATPFTSYDATTNNVYILLNSSTDKLTAEIRMYQANFDKNMKKKIDFVIEDVEYFIDAERGTISFHVDEAIPRLMTNNVKGEPMPSYKITDLQCTITAGFNTPGMFRFNCADRYELSAQLVEALPKDDK